MENKLASLVFLALLPTIAFAQAPGPAPAPAPVPQSAVPVTVPPQAAAPASPAAPEVRVENVVIGKDDFTRMQRDILVLKKRLEEVELRAQIAAKMKDIEKLNAPPTPEKEAVLIFKSMRQSIDGERTAQFQTPDGATIIAREGDTLPNGMRVASIRNDSVTLRKGAVIKRLGVGGVAAQSNPPAGSSGGAMPYGAPR